MSISLEEVSRIAKLSKLEFTDTEKTKLQQELSSILNYVDELKQLEGKTEASLDLDGLNQTRDDVAVPVENPDEFLGQAPGRLGKFIKVKSILD